MPRLLPGVYRFARNYLFCLKSSLWACKTSLAIEICGSQRSVILHVTSPSCLSLPACQYLPHRLRPGRRNSLKSPERMSCCCHLRHVLYWWLCVEFQALWAILCVCCKSVLHLFYSSEKHCYLYLYAVGASEICVSRGCSSGHVGKVNITQLISAPEHGIWYFCPWNMLVLVLFQTGEGEGIDCYFMS